MGGICGFVDKSPSPEERKKLLLRMMERLKHRGPDDNGWVLTDHAALGFTRLTIMGPHPGKKPLCNEDGTVHVICDGEIFNSLELGESLKTKGHSLASGADAEIIAHLYEEYGDGFVNRLRGMFTIAVWDERTSELLLVRDRPGVKPLHYAKLANGRFLFASEQKAILADRSVPRDPDRPAIWDVFALGFVAGEKTLFSSIRRVGPGQILRFRNGTVETNSYWQLGLAAGPGGNSRSPGDWTARVRDKLEESVKVHLRSGVPVAAWLGPGIASSSIVALMHQLGTGIPQTFTLACQDPDTGEMEETPTLTTFPGYQDIPNEIVHLRHSHFEWLPDAVLHCEDPFTSAAEIAHMVLAKASSDAYKVVLTSEASEGVFGDRGLFRKEKLRYPLRHVPESIRRRLARANVLRRRWPVECRMLADPGKPMGLDRYRELIGPPTFPDIGISLFSHEFLRHLPRKAETSAAESMKRIVPGDHEFLRFQALDLLFRLPDCVAQRLDRASMAYGLEARVPFLDHELMELCAGMPPELKLTGRGKKHILGRAMKDTLPREVFRCHRHRVSTPYAKWLRGPLPEFASEYFSEKALMNAGYFDPAAVRQLLKTHREGRINHGRILLGILGIQLWDRLLRAGKPA